MKVAPFRALTQLSLRNILLDYFSRRNEGRPIQGIDTSPKLYWVIIFITRRNEGRPIQGIDTHIYLFPALS